MTLWTAFRDDAASWDRRIQALEKVLSKKQHALDGCQAMRKATDKVSDAAKGGGRGPSVNLRPLLEPGGGIFDSNPSKAGGG